MRQRVQQPLRFGRRYPWNEWFSQKRFTLHQGQDYACRTYAMAQQVRIAAGPRRHNMRVQIQVAEDEKSLTVEVLGER